MDEKELVQILQQDISVGTEKFRDALLQRCLEELADDGVEEAQGQVIALSDSDLDLLAAAGDATAAFDDPAARGL